MVAMYNLMALIAIWITVYTRHKVISNDYVISPFPLIFNTTPKHHGSVFGLFILGAHMRSM